MKTVEHDLIKDRIASLDLEPIKFKLVKEQALTEDQVLILEKWYRRFLFLTFKHKEQPIVVSQAIDNFWHQHILDTRKYADDCRAAFGEFLHHFPYFGLRGDEDQRALRLAYQTTLKFMRDEYGETPEDDFKVFGSADATAAELPSLCSDGGLIKGARSYFDQRPRLTRDVSM